MQLRWCCRRGIDASLYCAVEREEVHSGCDADRDDIQRHGLYELASGHDAEPQDRHDGDEVAIARNYDQPRSMPALELP